MIIVALNNGERDLEVHLVHHITSWYVKFSLLLGVDISFTTDSVGNKNKTLAIDFLCFRLYIDYWRRNDNNRTV